MTDRTTLRTAAVAALILANTEAGDAVYSPRDWPTGPKQYPCIIVRTPHERKENAAPRTGPPVFFSTITLTAVGRVESLTEDDAEEKLELLSQQIEEGLLRNNQFIYEQGVQQFSSVETTMEIRSDSDRHYGETVTVFSIEVYQEYDPIIDAAGVPIAPDLTTIDVIVDNGPDGEQMAHAIYTLTGV